MKLLRRTEFKNGLIIWLILGVFFLLMDAMGLANVPYLKIFNIVFILFGVNMTLRHYAKKGANYGQLFVKGCYTAFLGIGLALLGLIFYLEVLLGGVDMSQYSTTVIPTTGLSQYVLALFAEGISSAVIVVFVLLQYWKNFAENKQRAIENKL